MKNNEKYEKLKLIFKNVSKVEITSSNENADLKKHLGLDSLAKVRIAVEAEKTFGLDIDPSNMTQITTFNQLLNFIEEFEMQGKN